MLETGIAPPPPPEAVRVEAALQAAIDRHGPALLYEPRVLRDFLEQRCPDAAFDISLLLNALDEQVPQELLGVYSKEELRHLVARLEHRLSEHHAFNPFAAAWAVRTWGDVLRVDENAAIPLEARPGAAREPVPAPASVPRMPEPDTRHTAPLPPWLEAMPDRTISDRLRPWYGLVGVLVVVAAFAGAIVMWTSASERERDASGRSPAGSAGGASRGRAEAPLAPRAASTPVGADAAKPKIGTGAPETVLRAPATPASMMPASSIPTPTAGAAAPPLATPLPPVIVGIAIPRTIAPGRPFVATIVYRAGDDLQVSVERKVVAGALGAGPAVTVTPASGLTSPKGGALSYPVDALRPASRATVEFTLIDGNGLRSEPKRVEFEAAAMADGMAATACTRATCGSVVAVREIRGAADIDARTRIANATGKSRGAGPARYEVIVRMDDRSIHTVNQPVGPRVGTRVRLAGARLMAQGARSSSGATALPEGRLLPESVPITSP